MTASELEAKPKQVHAQQPVVGIALAPVDCLVPDRDAALVDAHLEAPHPPRARAEHGQRLAGLGNLAVGAAEHGAGRIALRGVVAQRLTLVRRPIAVLGEDHRAIGGC